MKRLKNVLGIICTVLMTVHLSFGQVSDAALTTQSNVIRDETVAGANTKTRIAAMYQAIIDSKVSLIKFPAPSSIGTSLQQLRVVSGGGSLEWYTPAGAAVWGSISGLITDQSDLTAALNLKAALNSPTFTGVPAVPTASPGTNTTQAASTAFVTAAVSSGSVADGDKGDITVSGSGSTWTIDNAVVSGSKIASSVALAGSPTTTTQSVGDNSTKISTTAYADAKVADAVNDGVTTIAPSQNSVFDALALKSPLYPAINTQTSNYALVLTDVGKTVEMNITSTANNVTIPLNATVAFPLYTQIPIVQYGTGLTSVVATGGVTIRSSSGNLNSPGQYSPMVLEKRGTDEWYLWNGTAGSTGAALTKTDDTNVTATLGGSSSTALVNAASITLGWTGTLAGTRGGTGTATTAVGDILYGTASNTWSKLAAVAAGSVLGSAGTTTAPAYLAVSNGLTADATSFKLGGALTANTNISGAFSLGLNVSPSGKFHIQSLGSTSATYGFKLQNSTPAIIFEVRDDAKVEFGSGSVASIFPGVNGTGSVAGGGMNYVGNFAGSNLVAHGMFSTFSGTTGLGIGTRLNKTFNPASGSATHDAFQIFTTINQTGGANGNSADLHIIPTRTAVGGRHDNIVVEDSPITGWSVFGSATPVATLTTAGSFATGFVQKSALYTLTAGDHTVEVTTGTHTQTLPTAVGIAGRQYTITNSGTGVVTVGTTSSQTFVNILATPTTQILNQFQSITVESNGANWLKVAGF